jgi:hypothetical protein
MPQPFQVGGQKARAGCQNAAPFAEAHVPAFSSLIAGLL